jgi:hypothetical protein
VLNLLHPFRYTDLDESTQNGGDELGGEGGARRDLHVMSLNVGGMGEKM